VEASEQRPWFTDEDLEYYSQFLQGHPEIGPRDFRTLLATISEVLGETDLNRLLRKLVEQVLFSTRAERGILVLEEDGELSVRVALDQIKHDLGSDPAMARTVVDSVFRTGQPIIQSVTGDHEVLDVSQSAASLRLRQVMCAPLRARGKIIGVIYVDSTLGRVLHTEDDLKLFHAQAGLMGMAVENHRLFREAWDARDVQRQLDVARDIQRRLFPKSPAVYGEIQLAGQTDICAQVGGDYFDYLRLDIGGVGLGIGDVSGHGIAPALIMSDVRARVRSLLQAQGVLTGVYGAINYALCSELPDGMYVALFVAIYDPGRGILEYQNAGHVAPLLYSPDVDRIRKIPPNAPAFGLFEGASAEPCPTLAVERGDYLVCYTDGVLERPNEDGEIYGEERLNTSIRRAARAGAEPAEVMQAIRADAEAHAAGRPLRDDFTVLVARL
jgi:sigma-B regulation protein RsbU (phosphoserine phosphatase)